MIEELKLTYYNRVGYPPDAMEITEKINEIIRQVNTLTMDMQIRYMNEDEK